MANRTDPKKSSAKYKSYADEVLSEERADIDTMRDDMRTQATIGLGIPAYDLTRGKRKFAEQWSRKGFANRKAAAAAFSRKNLGTLSRAGAHPAVLGTTAALALANEGVAGASHASLNKSAESIAASKEKIEQRKAQNAALRSKRNG